MEPVTAAILVVDDERHLSELLCEHLGGRGYAVHTAYGGRAGLALALELRPKLVLLDLKLGDMSGLEVLAQLRRAIPDVEVAVITGNPEVSSAIAAIEGRVAAYLCKPFGLDQLDAVVARTVGPPPGAAPDAAPPGSSIELIGESKATLELRRMIRHLAATNVRAALITGESGTGKDLVARLIHAESDRRHAAFVDVNCAAVTEALFESEFFGHERGAFTGAVATRRGLAELAHGGTLFLDEIGEMSRASQAKLLRFLEDQSFFRVGGTRKVRVDVRIVAATNRDLREMVEQQAFRQDLYFRLDVASLALAPLRERPEDILPLADFWLRDATARFGRQVSGFSDDVQAALLEHPWPGNVRELRNLVERLVLFTTGERIEMRDLPAGYQLVDRAAGAPSSSTLAAIERSHIRRVLDSVSGNKTKAAEILGITRQTLRTKLSGGAGGR
jgi:DNA-binding NtrC family response regulator